MNQFRKKNKIFEILEDVTVVYTDGYKMFYKAIRFDDHLIITGHVAINGKFIEEGGIPRDNIKEIIYETQDKNIKKILLGQ